MYDDAATIIPPMPPTTDRSNNNSSSPQIIVSKRPSLSSSCSTLLDSAPSTPDTPPPADDRLAEEDDEESRATAATATATAPLMPEEELLTDNGENNHHHRDNNTTNIIIATTLHHAITVGEEEEGGEGGAVDLRRIIMTATSDGGRDEDAADRDGAAPASGATAPAGATSESPALGVATTSALAGGAAAAADPMSPDTPRFSAFLDFINGPAEEASRDAGRGVDASEAGEAGSTAAAAVANAEGRGAASAAANENKCSERTNDDTTMATETTPLGTTEVLPSADSIATAAAVDNETTQAAAAAAVAVAPITNHNNAEAASSSSTTEARPSEARPPRKNHPPSDAERPSRVRPPSSPLSRPPRYRYSQRYPPGMEDFTTVQNSKTKVGQRCYRMNLERPFDIHCEQSPLEYGDYMAPWTKEVFPATVGPTEYCPPRHLGGEEVVWRELMRWSDAADRAGKGYNYGRRTNGGDDDGCFGERKVNSLDEVDDGGSGKVDGEGDKTIAKGAVSPGGSVRLDAEVDAAAARIGTVDLSDEENRGGADEFETSPSAATAGTAAHPRSFGAAAANVGTLPTGGWRTLPSDEVDVVRQLGGRNPYGEYAFRTYDLSHVLLNTAKGVMKDHNDEVRRVTDFPGVAKLTQESIPPLRTVFSMDSTTSEDERDNPKSAEEMANDTARLFRRSEFSLKENAERDAAEEAEKERLKREKELREMEERRRRERETGLLSDDSPLDKSQRRKTRAKKFLKGLSRGVSKTIGDMNGTSESDASWRGSSHRGRANSTSSAGRGAGMVKRSSMQALTIDKARDLVDESDDDVSVEGGDDDEDEANKKPLNVALYIFGEYDTLNDLAKDGAKRLGINKEGTDLDILKMNDPCPPPDRWVRTTGWSKCNPSSMYAIYPPEDFDWIRYNDHLRLRTEDYKEKFLGDKGPQDGIMARNARPHHNNSGMTESTAAASTSTSGEGQPPPPPSHGRKASRTPELSPIMSPSVPRVKTATTESTLTPTTPMNRKSGADMLSQSARAPRTSRSSSNSSSGGAKSHFNKPSSNAAAVDPLCQSARTPRGSSKLSRFRSASNAAPTAGTDTLSQSARVPRRSSSTSTGAKGHFNKSNNTASDVDSLSQSARTPRGGKRGFGRRMSSILKGK